MSLQIPPSSPKDYESHTEINDILHKDISQLAKNKIEEANSKDTIFSLIGKKFAQIGSAIDRFFGNWFSSRFAQLFRSKLSNEYELEELVNTNLEEVPIDECFSANEFKIAATKEGAFYVGEKILIKGVYGYRLLEVDEIDGDEIVIKDFYELKTHIHNNNIWHLKPSAEIRDPKLRSKVFNLTQK